MHGLKHIRASVITFLKCALRHLDFDNFTNKALELVCNEMVCLLCVFVYFS